MCIYYKYHIDTYLYTSIDINIHGYVYTISYLYIRPSTAYK